MAQYDVYRRRTGPGFLVDCQSEMLSLLNTRFVVPLLPRKIVPSLVPRLNPIFLIESDDLVLMPQNVATVSVRELDRAIASLTDQRYVIMNALDLLLTGY